MTTQKLNKKTFKKNLQNGFSIAMVIILFLAYLFLWKIQINDPEIYYTADFVAFYTAGKIASEQSPAIVYAQPEQLHIQEELREKKIISSDLLSYNHLPYLIPVLKLVINESYTSSFARWALLLFAFNIANAFILLKILPVKKQAERIILFVGIILFYPSFISILKGQDTLIMLLGISLWTLGLLQKKNHLAGIGLSLATLRPHIALILAIPFLFKRQKVFWWFAASASLLAFFSIFLVGIQGSLDFIELLRISSRGEGYQLNMESMFNLVGVFARFFPTLSYNFLEIIGWTGFILAIVSLSILWAKSEEVNEALVGTAIILSLFFAPHLHYHDLALLLIPLLITLKIANKKRKLPSTAQPHILLGTSFVLFLNYYLPSIYLLPYLFMILLGISLWFLASQSNLLEAK